ncbi:hypothetical protein IWQ62_005604 [Dispira parvispora]|uniref:PITH domain-containing protein n=1 Tax=Dispira parvispora TaxID=1520584 RepID=A0A9W8AIE6_9FUNG|nr:hypothetical protein IWQ62_005604 [Dispira parvispora]
MQEITAIDRFRAAVDRSADQVALSESFTQVEFIKVDIDAAKEIARDNVISSVPTFLIYKDRQKVAQVTGAKLKEIEDQLRQWGGNPTKPYSFNKRQGSEGSSSGNQAASPPAGDTYGVRGHQDLSSSVLATQVGCLNQSDTHPVGNVLKKDSSYLQSDVDEQLLIYIPFNQKVRLHSLKFMAPLENAPHTVRVYANRPNLNFDEVDTVQPTQVLNLTEEDYTAQSATALRFVRFQNVTSITLFIENNLADEDTTIVQQIVPIGTAVESTNVSDIRQSEQ